MFSIEPNQARKFLFGQKDTEIINPKDGTLLVSEKYDEKSTALLESLCKFPSYCTQNINNNLEYFIIKEEINFKPNNKKTIIKKILADKHTTSPSKESEKILLDLRKDSKLMGFIQEQNVTFLISACNFLYQMDMFNFIKKYSEHIWFITERLLKQNQLDFIELTKTTERTSIFLKDCHGCSLINIIKNFKIKNLQTLSPIIIEWLRYDYMKSWKIKKILIPPNLAKKIEQIQIICDLLKQFMTWIEKQIPEDSDCDNVRQIL